MQALARLQYAFRKSCCATYMHNFLDLRVT